MSFLIIFCGAAVLLWALAFLSKRRFGVLGLALAAGASMSTVWVGDVTPFIASVGVAATQPPLESLVSAGLILLPAAVLLLGGPVYRGKGQRIVGAVFFALLAMTLLLEPLAAALVIEGPGKMVYDALYEYRIFIVTACVVVALIDIVTMKTPKTPTAKA